MADRAESYDALIRAPFGRIGLQLRDGVVSAIDFLPGAAPVREPATPAARRLAREIRAYLRDPDAPISAVEVRDASPFRQRVWRALRRIPRGTTRSYGALAREMGTSARAVGGACRSNPLPLVVPCHRVVAQGGAGGFMGKRAGFPLRVKRWLLAHEGAG